MAVQAETGESASDSGIKQVEVEAAAPISEVRFGIEGVQVAKNFLNLACTGKNLKFHCNKIVWTFIRIRF